MTEAEWLACGDPNAMFGHVLRDPEGGRKARLFGCAACRRFWDDFEDARCREAIDASERYADGLLSERELDLLSGSAEEAFEDAVDERDDQLMHLTGAASSASSPALSPSLIAGVLEGLSQASWSGPRNERAAQAELLRDIFGNPFRPPAFDSAWRTSTALAVARGMYDSRDFSATPILADALQDAGCNNEIALAHCRDPQQVHVRGCWVVDLVLGKG